MALRTRLLLVFLCVASVVVVVFGLVAYQIAEDAGTKNELAVLARSVRDQAAKLAQSTDASRDLAKLRNSLNTYTTSDDTVFLTNANAEVLAAAGAYAALTPPAMQPAAAGSREIDSDGRRLLWARAPLGSTGYFLYGVRPPVATTSLSLDTLWIRLAVTGILVLWLSIWGALIFAAVVSRRLEAQNAKLVYQSIHDPLTQLPNRTLLYDRLQQAISAGRRDNTPLALFVMDLDRFKDINDTLGHHTGDLLLHQVGLRLTEILRDSDTVARLGGDEFAVLLRGVTPVQAMTCANKIMQSLQQPFVVDEIELSIDISIGITIFPDHGADANSLIQRADVAMYQAKQSSSGFMFYTPESDTYSLRRLILVGDLHHAIERNELMLHYQPKVDLVGQRVIGVEALLRWHHPTQGLIPPAEFIPLAEQSGLIRPLTAWVLRSALEQCEVWRKQGIQLSVAVNISVRNLQDTQFALQVQKLLEDSGTKPSCLELEITESAMMADTGRAHTILHRLDAMGIRLSVDDFGTGFSSLAYLKSLPIGALKIDRSFVMNMNISENDAIIVRSTIRLAHDMGLRVVAEGVENQATLDALTALGCDTAQGYYLARPLPLNEINRWLRESRWRIANEKKIEQETADIILIR